MQIKDQILQELEKIVKKLTNLDIEISLSIPKDDSHGDYSSNVAMQAFARKSDVTKTHVPGGEKESSIWATPKGQWKTPLELAEDIVEKLRTSGNLQEKVKVEAVKPGFINFTLTKDILITQAQRMLQEPEKIGTTTTMAGKKVMVEFTDPNPFKEFHIGHLYSNIVGESLSRLLESQGAEVRRVTYQGDVGLHVAKAIWGIIDKLKELNKSFKELEEEYEQFRYATPPDLNTDARQAKFLGETYARGARAYEENEIAKQEIIALNKKIYTREDAEINDLYDRGKKWSLHYFDLIYAMLGTKFVKNYFESESGPKGIEIVKNHITDGIFEEHDGAVVFRGEQYGLHTRVFINSLGLPTYEAKELGLAPTKYADFPYDESIIITGNEINEYFKVLLKALSLISSDLAKKTKHMSHGMVRLPEGKMSSRTGNVITGMFLINDAIAKIAKVIDPSIQLDQYSSSAVYKKAEPVGIGAVKYALLKSNIGKDIEYDFDKIISLEGNSGPYVQYTFTRTQSVLEKANAVILGTRSEALRTPESDSGQARMTISNLHYPSDYTPNDDELRILRYLQKFDEVVEEAATTYSPNLVTEYLFNLSQIFNNFYQKYRILNAPAKQDREFRLALTATVGTVIKQGLGLLGIQAPARM